MVCLKRCQPLGQLVLSLCRWKDISLDNQRFEFLLTWGDSFLVWGELILFEKSFSGDLNIAVLNLGGSAMMGGP